MKMIKLIFLLLFIQSSRLEEETEINKPISGSLTMLLLSYTSNDITRPLVIKSEKEQNYFTVLNDLISLALKGRAVEPENTQENLQESFQPIIEIKSVQESLFGVIQPVDQETEEQNGIETLIDGLKGNLPMVIIPGHLENVSDESDEENSIQDSSDIQPSNATETPHEDSRRSQKTHETASHEKDQEENFVRRQKPQKDNTGSLSNEDSKMIAELIDTPNNIEFIPLSKENITQQNTEVPIFIKRSLNEPDEDSKDNTRGSSNEDRKMIAELINTSNNLEFIPLTKGNASTASSSNKSDGKGQMDINRKPKVSVISEDESIVGSDSRNIQGIAEESLQKVSTQQNTKEPNFIKRSLDDPDEDQEINSFEKLNSQTVNENDIEESDSQKDKQKIIDEFFEMIKEIPQDYEKNIGNLAKFKEEYEPILTDFADKFTEILKAQHQENSAEEKFEEENVKEKLRSYLMNLPDILEQLRTQGVANTKYPLWDYFGKESSKDSPEEFFEFLAAESEKLKIFSPASLVKKFDPEVEQSQQNDTKDTKSITNEIQRDVVQLEKELQEELEVIQQDHHEESLRVEEGATESSHAIMHDFMESDEEGDASEDQKDKPDTEETPNFKKRMDGVPSSSVENDEEKLKSNSVENHIEEQVRVEEGTTAEASDLEMHDFMESGEISVENEEIDEESGEELSKESEENLSEESSEEFDVPDAPIVSVSIFRRADFDESNEKRRVQSDDDSNEEELLPGTNEETTLKVIKNLEVTTSKMTTSAPLVLTTIPKAKTTGLPKHSSESKTTEKGHKSTKTPEKETTTKSTKNDNSTTSKPSKSDHPQDNKPINAEITISVNNNDESFKSFDENKILVCDDLVCPSSTKFCKYSFKALPPTFVQSVKTSECLDASNHSIKLNQGIVENKTPGHFYKNFDIQNVEEKYLNISFGDFFIPSH